MYLNYFDKIITSDLGHLDHHFHLSYCYPVFCCVCIVSEVFCIIFLILAHNHGYNCRHTCARIQVQRADKERLTGRPVFSRVFLQSSHWVL